ncbi:MAG: hypothetical protein E6J72_17455 [Deltaproteobacteria bacterium]|nr:MAG: hypothetical protein E6J72_17455 [Deltaproteobacteria bacterium]
MIAVVLVGCGGFLLGILWMDLMFDVQVRRGDTHHDGDERERVESIARYYRRVTTDAAPMSRLIATVMIVQLGGIAGEIVTHRVGGWSVVAALVLGVAPIGLALVRIVPDAVRLGAQRDAPATQLALARRIYRAHVLCFAAIAVFIALQIRLARG